MSGYVQVVGQVTATNGKNRKTATAACPSDKKVFGGDYQINPKSPKDNGGILAVREFPAGPATWTVTAAEIDHASAGWSLRAFAICASAP